MMWLVLFWSVIAWYNNCIYLSNANTRSLLRVYKGCCNVSAGVMIFINRSDFTASPSRLSPLLGFQSYSSLGVVYCSVALMTFCNCFGEVSLPFRCTRGLSEAGDSWSQIILTSNQVKFVPVC